MERLHDCRAVHVEAGVGLVERISGQTKWVGTTGVGLWRDGGARPVTGGHIRARFPAAHVLGCSTAGEIAGTQVLDDTFVATAVHFDKTQLASAQIELSAVADSFDAGRRLAQALDPRGLVHVLAISDGLQVNGSELVRRVTRHLPAGVSVSGGLSADGARFQKTLVLCGDGARSGRVAAVGFYGDSLKVHCASRGGWDTFGPERRATRSKGNVLYELDGQSALELYKSYLGEYAKDLPASGLLFPLKLLAPAGGSGVRCPGADDFVGKLSGPESGVCGRRAGRRGGAADAGQF